MSHMRCEKREALDRWPIVYISFCSSVLDMRGTFISVSWFVPPLRMEIIITLVACGSLYFIIDLWTSLVGLYMDIAIFFVALWFSLMVLLSILLHFDRKKK